MKEKKLTDEVVVAKNAITDDEIVNAYIHCVLKRGDCDNCPYDEVGCGVDGNDLIKIINRQKAEIERLTEENKKLVKEIDLEVELQTKRKRQIIAESQEFIDELANKTAELQKQVDELKERAKIDLANERNWGKIQTKQAVKDTAKEICDLILEHWEKKQFVECDWLRVAISERYGVEAE